MSTIIPDLISSSDLMVYSISKELDSLSSSSSAQKEEVQFDPAEDVITVSNGGRVSPFDLRFEYSVPSHLYLMKLSV